MGVHYGSVTPKRESKLPKQSWWYTVAGKPFYGVFVGLTTLLAGSLASLFSHEIKAYFTGVVENSPHLKWLANLNDRQLSITFVVCIAIWSLLFFVRQTAGSRSLNALQKNADKIREAVFTLPPSGFLKAFSEETTSIYSRLLSGLPRQVDPSTQITELELIIRKLLSGVARLANAYDPARRARYAANVMIYIQRADNAPYFPVEYTKEKIRQFLQNVHDPEDLEGILVLQKELSATVDTQDKPDDTLQDVIFGIPPIRNNDSEILEIAPGAARAFVNWRIEKAEAPTALRHAIHGLDDIRTMTRADLERDHCTLSEEVISKLHDFYRYNGPGGNIVSFQAYPLVLADQERTAIGVLNIHCDKPTFLGPVSPQEAIRRQQSFAGMVTPLVFEIAAAASCWWEIKTSKPRA